MNSLDNTTPHKSSDYDRHVRQTIPFYETMHWEAVDLVHRAMPGASCWLDTGCGTGYLVELALPLFPETQFLLADPSAAMLEQAALRFQDLGPSRLRFLDPVTSQDLPFQLDGTVPQVVTAMQAHHYLQPPERRRAVEACYRVLGDEGLFVSFENIAPRTETGIRLGLDRWGHFQIQQGRSPEVVAQHRTRFDTRYFPVTVDQHLALLNDVGFRVVELFWFSQMQAGFYGLK
jgi:tRNA (cmo5U34)-methyltransferase